VIIVVLPIKLDKYFKYYLFKNEFENEYAALILIKDFFYSRKH